MRSRASSAWCRSDCPAKHQAVRSVVVTSCARVASALAKWARAARKLSLSDIVNCDRKARQVVVRIARKEPFAERGRARFVAIGESGGEGALEKIGISRIGPEGFPVVDFRRKRVPVSAGDKSRKIISGLAGSNLQPLRSGFGLDSCGGSRAAGERQSRSQDEGYAQCPTLISTLHVSRFPTIVSRQTSEMSTERIPRWPLR